MTIDEAVVILNQEKWRGRDDWVVTPWGTGIAVVVPITYHGKVGQAASQVLHCEDAIAIASYLELREAVKPVLASWGNDGVTPEEEAAYDRLVALMPSAADSEP